MRTTIYEILVNAMEKNNGKDLGERVLSFIRNEDNDLWLDVIGENQYDIKPKDYAIEIHNGKIYMKLKNRQLEKEMKKDAQIERNIMLIENLLGFYKEHKERKNYCQRNIEKLNDKLEQLGMPRYPYTLN